ncbi:hypothetical protein DEA8626_01158 [Defluviimonas aquaemixtae]|uniref:DUF7742 domain-containing protein n=1 Tax=Albidovulum aquaemixtae TaxID=1542388 RepID=A0A2R8B4S5_9RHOB|nr:hypothetical protein [Defluviimonas aquaemixtae]SPH17634.1 hypothetical protein DEA8626_01158 [Defluviimonas aquaemixtae]
MRPLTHGDVAVAANAVRSLPSDARCAEVLRFLDRAHAADLFRKRTGRAHPFWGDGSLMGAVLKGSPVRAEPFLSDPEHLSALAVVIETLLDWKHRR